MLAEARCSSVDGPAPRAVSPAQSVVCVERAAPPVGIKEGASRGFPVLWMHCVEPAEAETLLRGLPP